MKRKMDHHEREAWIMAAILPAIVVIGAIAGVIMPLVLKWLHH